jgi:glycerate kinase
MSLSVVIAPDSFKGSLAATAVAQAIAAGWLSVRPDDNVSTIPLADGGEGTLDAIEAAAPGSTRHDAGPVVGPDGRPVRSEWLELPGLIGVVELAQMSGLPLMGELDALGATTFGLGQVIAHALDTGMQQLIIGLGGSASTDGGAGALAALGLRATNLGDSGSDPLANGGEALLSLTSLNVAGLRPPPPGGVILLTDVSAPLLGATGAAAVFGPQKGADPAQVGILDAALAHFANLLGGDVDDPGTGAAGGTAYGFAAAWGATIQPGAEYIMRLTGAEERTRSADIVVTGEGRFDETSITGKLVGELISFASEGPARIGVIAGAIAAKPVSPNGAMLWSRALLDLAGSAEEAMANPARWLHDAGAQAAHELPGS